MRSMLKIMLLLGLLFASTFLILNLTGVITLEKIKHWFSLAQNLSPWAIGIVVASLLFSDLFVAMPTLTIMILAGFFLGPIGGAMSAICGLTLAGFSGYILSYRYGDLLLRRLVRKSSERHDAIASFRRHGIITILLSRAMPILPEVSACMAGLTKLPINHFAFAWLSSTVPYAIIASYAGSMSSLSNPQPAIFTAIGLTGFMWLGWFLFRKHQAKHSSATPSQTNTGTINPSPINVNSIRMPRRNNSSDSR